MSHAAEREAELIARREELTALLEENQQRRDRDAETCRQAREALEAAEETFARLNGEAEELQKQADELEEKITGARTGLEDLQKQDEALRQELAGLFALAFGRKKEVRSRIEENSRALAEAQERLTALEGQRDPEPLNGTREKAETARAELEPLETEAAAAEDRLSAQEETCRQSEQELSALEEELSALRQAERERQEQAEQKARKAADCARSHPEWPALDRDRLRDRRDRAMSKLETLYPEHKVFALAALNDELRSSLVKLAEACGFETVDELLAAHGFERITGQAVRQLRPRVQYAPGREPPIIRGKVEGILRRLEKYYPDHSIRGGLERDHKALSGDISGVAQWLGYGSRKNFLEAYGYRYDNAGTGGRPPVEVRPILEALLREYANREDKPQTLAALVREHPEFKGQLKTLSNRSGILFGEPLTAHLRRLEILAGTP